MFRNCCYKVCNTYLKIRTTQNTIKQCRNIIDPTKGIYIIQMNTQAPRLKAKIIIHKPSSPNRPVISSICAPTQKIAKTSKI
jgi:hypothetical protein